MPGAGRLDCRDERHPVFSVLYGRTLHVGRVVSPTLAMTVMREAEIAAFVPESFYTVNLSLPEMTATRRTDIVRMHSPQLSKILYFRRLRAIIYCFVRKEEKPMNGVACNMKMLKNYIFLMLSML